MMLKAAQGTRTNTRELNRLASKWNIDASNLDNVWSLKVNVERSRREYLDLKAQQVACRRKYLERTGRLAKWKKKVGRDNVKGATVLSARGK